MVEKYANWCSNLNARVDEITAKDAGSMKEHPEALAAVKGGTVVYQQRSEVFVGGLLMVLFYCFATSPSLAYTAMALAIMYFYVDFYGAVLHVVLDHPPFITMPIIGPGCLEFQWHHAIPNDIVSKPFVQVCGDLNLVALLHVVWLIVINGGLGNRAANTMAAAKLAMAYLGQWAHRMAHTPHSQRPEWVRAAQSLGALVSPILHKAHHTTYDDGFPILSGVTAPVVSAFNHWVPNRYLWLWAFAVLSLADVQLCTMLCTAYFPVLAGKGAAAEVSWFRF